MKRKGVVLNKRAVQLGRNMLRKVIMMVKKYSLDVDQADRKNKFIADHKAKLINLKKAKTIGRNFM